MVLMQVHSRNVFYDPARGVNKFNPLRMGGKETKWEVYIYESRKVETVVFALAQGMQNADR